MKQNSLKRASILFLILFVIIFNFACEEEWYPSQTSENLEDSEFQKEHGYLAYAMSKIKILDFPAMGIPQENGRLPRSLWKFTLGGMAPPLGVEYRDNQKIYLVQNEADNRRIRVYSREGIIFRIVGFTDIRQLTDQTPEYLFQQIKAIYGTPDKEILEELTYLDDETVVVFKIGGHFLLIDISDLAMADLPEHIYQLNDKNYLKKR